MEENRTFCGYRCDLCQFYTNNVESERDKERVSEEFNRIPCQSKERMLKIRISLNNKEE